MKKRLSEIYNKWLRKSFFGRLFDLLTLVFATYGALLFIALSLVLFGMFPQTMSVIILTLLAVWLIPRPE